MNHQLSIEEAEELDAREAAWEAEVRQRERDFEHGGDQEWRPFRASSDEEDA